MSSNMGLIITDPATDIKHSVDGETLMGGDFSKTIMASDGTISDVQIRRYHKIAMGMDWQDGWYSTPEMKAKSEDFSSYKHIHLGGSKTEVIEYDIEQDWVQEIWDEVNPSPGKGACVLHRHYLNGHSAGQSGGIHVDAWTGNQYTVIVYLTPDWRPEDGGSLELWTPNLNDEQRAMAINTPYGFGKGRVPEMNIIKSYWPRTGRVVVFDSRLPRVARSVEGDKFRVSLVFKCQLIRNHIL